MNFRTVKNLLLLEFTTEWREKHQLFSLLLYMLTSVYVAYQIFHGQVDDTSWNALFWVILVFGAITTLTRSFQRETKHRFYFYFQWTHPLNYIMSKILFNSLLMLLISSLNFSLFLLFFNTIPENIWMYILAITAGGLAFATTLTLVAAIAAKSEGNTALMAILSFPVLMPQILVLSRLSDLAILGVQWGDFNPYLIATLALDVATVTLSYLLFPYLWSD